MPHRATDSLPPIAAPIPPPMDPMDFEATNPLPPVDHHDRAAYERGQRASTIELRVASPSGLISSPPETVPAIGALSARATPLATAVPDRVHRKRRLMLIGFGSTLALAVVGSVAWGVSWPAAVGALVGGYVGMIAHEVVLHRLLAHRAFRVGRVTRFVLTAFTMMWPARSPIWWAATHRHHHKHADTDADVHSPRGGRWRAFIGWPFEPRAIAFARREVGDLMRLPELRLLDRAPLAPFLLSLIPCALAGWAVGEMWPGSGMNAGQGLVWWGVWRAFYPTVGMGLVNVVAHDPRRGERAYETDDGSRNVRWLSWLTAGTGWHNNHHHYAHAARSGFRPGQFDPSYRVIEQLSKMGLADDVRQVPDAVLAGAREETPAG